MTQPTASQSAVPAPRSASPRPAASIPWQVSASTLLTAEVVVIGDGPYPGADAVLVAREIAHRLDADQPGRVVLLAHTPRTRRVDDVGVARPRIPRHWVGPLLRGWAGRGLDWAEGQAELVAVREQIEAGFGVSSLHGSGVLVASGEVTMLSRGRVALDTAGPDPESHVLGPQRTVIATGSVATVPDVPGIGEARVLDAEGLLDLPELPASVVVVGAGEHGCELAQGLARLGATVTLIEVAGRPVAHLPDAAAEAVVRTLAADGVRMICDARLVSVAPTLDGGAWVGTDTGGDVAAEALVLATGRRPRTGGLDLAAAGITIGRGGVVEVDERMRTAANTVLASGEVTGLAGYGAAPGPMARVVAANVVGRRPGLRWGSPAAAQVVRTDPEVVVLGRCEPEEGAVIGEGDGPYPGTSVRVMIGSPVGRGLLGGRLGSGGARGRSVVGAMLVGPGAAESIGQLVLAVNTGTPAASLVDIEAPEGTWTAAVQSCIARALAGGDGAGS